MSRHTQGSLAIVGAIAAGIFLVAFVAMLVLGDLSVSAAGFLAAIVALVAAVVLYRGFASSSEVPAPVAAPSAAPVSTPAPAPAPVAEPELEAWAGQWQLYQCPEESSIHGPLCQRCHC